MKRRSFFRSLIAAPFAAVGAVVIAPVFAKPAATKPLGELAVKIDFDMAKFKAEMARVNKALDEVAQMRKSPPFTGAYARVVCGGEIA